MLDGKRYFACFPDETHAAPRAGEPQTNEPQAGDPQTSEPTAKGRLLTPGLLAALADLDRELRSFLAEAGDEAGDDRGT
jgi:hypothetical protein